MKAKYTSFDTAYNRHIRNARKACSGFYGWTRAELIRDYFRENGHPHAQYTFDQLAIDRISDHQFAGSLMKEMAHLTALNDEGWYLNGKHYQRRVNLGFDTFCYIEYNHSSLHSVHCETSGYNHVVKEFDDFDSYDEWLDQLYDRSNYLKGKAQTGILVASILGFINENPAETTFINGHEEWIHDLNVAQ